LVIKTLLKDNALTAETLSEATSVSCDHLIQILAVLMDEGFICQENGLYKIA